MSARAVFPGGALAARIHGFRRAASTAGVRERRVARPGLVWLRRPGVSFETHLHLSVPPVAITLRMSHVVTVTPRPQRAGAAVRERIEPAWEGRIGSGLLRRLLPESGSGQRHARGRLRLYRERVAGDAGRWLPGQRAQRVHMLRPGRLGSASGDAPGRRSGADITASARAGDSVPRPGTHLPPLRRREPPAPRGLALSEQHRRRSFVTTRGGATHGPAGSGGGADLRRTHHDRDRGLGPGMRTLLVGLRRSVGAHRVSPATLRGGAVRGDGAPLRPSRAATAPPARAQILVARPRGPLVGLRGTGPGRATMPSRMTLASPGRALAAPEPTAGEHLRRELDTTVREQVEVIVDKAVHRRLSTWSGEVRGLAERLYSDLGARIEFERERLGRV